MDFWTQILTVPGMGGAFALSMIALWVFFLAGLVVWIAITPRRSD